MFRLLGSFVSRYWLAVLAAWIATAVLLHWVAPRWDEVTHDGDFAYLPPWMTSVQGERLLEAAFPEVLSKSQVIVVLSRRGGPLRAEDRAVADWLVERFTPPPGQDSPIVDVLSYQTEVLGEKLVSPAGPMGQAMLVILQLRTEFMAIGNWGLMNEVYQAIDTLRRSPGFPAGLELGVTGSAAVGYDMLASAEQSIRNTETTTIVLVLLILLVVYRAPGLVLIPVLTIGVSVWVATDLVALLTHGFSQLGWLDWKIFKTTRIFVVVILFGAGVDYCLFLVSRYREELERGLERGEAIAVALARVGDALAASALTTIAGLAAMVLADFGKFRNSGPVIAVCLVVALVASVTLAPALLRAAGRVVFWPFGQPGAGGGDRRGASRRWAGRFAPFWEWLSGQVIARPGRILIVSFFVLAPLAYHGLSVDVSYDLLRELGDDRPSVRGTRQLCRYFPAGETGPVTVLAYHEQGGFDDDRLRWEKIQGLADRFYQFRYQDTAGRRVQPVTSVRSALEPLGERPQRFGLFGAVRKGVLRGHHKTKSTYLAQAPGYTGKVARFDLVFAYDPFSVESLRLLDHLEHYLQRLAQDPDSPWYGARFYFLGTTAGIRDLRQVTLSDQVRIERVVPLVVLAVLLLILRRPVICVYLIVSVLFGFFVTMGATELVFSWAYGDAYHGLDWKVPIFLFVILVAVGEDYNVYLVTRVFEEQRRRGAVEGLRRAVVRTGGIITSCGVIMAGTFASMGTGSLRAMHQLGFALSAGVLLDTFVIRTVLVPCFLALYGRLRWRRPACPGPPEGDRQGRWDVRPGEVGSPGSRGLPVRRG